MTCGIQKNLISYVNMAEWLFYHKNVLIIFLTIVTQSNAYLDDPYKPCNYLDTINITDGEKNNDDGSIMFEGIYYSKALYSTYDYEFLNESYHQLVAPHTRGCTCKINQSKPCVRMCCPRGQYLKNRNCIANDSVSNLYVSFLNEDRLFVEGNIFDYFNYVVGKPCYALNTEETWILLQNGSVLLGQDNGNPENEMLNKNEYCFHPMPNNGSIELTLMTCFEPYVEDVKDYFLPYGMFISVPFLVVTILVYITLPELRNVHGKSLVCYLFGLAVGYSSLGYAKFSQSHHIEPALCQTLGYTAYCAFVAAFFWLSVISYDLWWNFSGIHTKSKSGDAKKFVFYSMYAWGSTIIMAVLCYLVDANPNIPIKFQPGIGKGTCFMGTTFWSQFLYLYLPMILIMCGNSTCFLLTAIKIHKVQIEMARVTEIEDSKIHRKNLDTEKSKCSLFLRLFIVMGVTWTMEVISFMVSADSPFFYVTDLMNTVQGVVIFFLFVMKARVRQLIIKRWNLWSKKVLPKKNESTQRSQTVKSTIKNDPIELADASNSTE